MNTIAESVLAYYDSNDFKDNYFACLAEQFHNEEGDNINRIIDLFNVSNYETRQALSNWKVINREQAKKIFDFIADNMSEFTRDFNGYYVGYTSIDSISFGEQEEQLTGIYNHKTKKEYSLKYAQKVFNDAGYYIRGEYAYYDLQKGLHVDLLGNIELLNNFLLTI